MALPHPVTTMQTADLSLGSGTRRNRKPTQATRAEGASSVARSQGGSHRAIHSVSGEMLPQLNREASPESGTKQIHRSRNELLAPKPSLGPSWLPGCLTIQWRLSDRRTIRASPGGTARLLIYSVPAPDGARQRQWGQRRSGCLPTPYPTNPQGRAYRRRWEYPLRQVLCPAVKFGSHSNPDSRLRKGNPEGPIQGSTTDMGYSHRAANFVL